MATLIAHHGATTIVSGKSSAVLARQQQLIVFVGLLLFVAVVSVHDAALLIVNQDGILEFEQNPVGSWLIEMNAGSVWLFIGVKLLGTSLVCAVLAGIYDYSRALGLVIASPLAAFQAVLLSYLYVG